MGGTGTVESQSLPARLTSFVGRDRELAELGRLVGASRLVSLVGAAGSGKTRLAIEAVARSELPARFADLTTAGGATGLEGFLCSALGLSEAGAATARQRLVVALGGPPQILLLDSPEHVREPVAAVAVELLHRCPALRIVATGREALGVDGEVVWPVSGMEPGDAAALFAARARLVRPSFETTESNSAAVADLCRALDDLPLAIELAAAWVRAMEPAEITARVRRSHTVLESFSRAEHPRHRSLTAALDWSYEQLQDGPRALLRRLSVFAGGFDADDAAAVGGGSPVDPDEVPELLQVLAGKSLLLVGAERGRFALLETVRQFCLERLDAAGELDLAVRRHGEHFVWLVEQAEAHSEGTQALAWSDRVYMNLDNLRRAVEWSETAGPDVQIRLATAAMWFMATRGHLEEEAAWLDAALDRYTENDVLRANGLRCSAWIAWRRGQVDLAGRRWEQAHALLRDAEARPELAETLTLLGDYALVARDLETAAGRYMEAWEVAAACDNARTTVNALRALGWLRWVEGQPGPAAELLDEAVSLGRERVHSQVLLGVLWTRALVLIHRGEHAAARVDLVEALEIGRDRGFPHGVASALLVMAVLEAAEGRPHLAVKLAAAADALLGATAAAVSAVHAPAIEPWLERARRSLAPRQLEAARQDLGPSTAEAAASLALNGSPVRAPRGGGLSRRERQVAELVAAGLTNRRIAIALGIGERTVETCVEHALVKLGFRNRAQIAGWVAGKR